MSVTEEGGQERIVIHRDLILLDILSWDLPLGIYSLRRHSGSYNLEHITFDLSMTLPQRSPEAPHSSKRYSKTHESMQTWWQDLGVWFIQYILWWKCKYIKNKRETTEKLKAFSYLLFTGISRRFTGTNKNLRPTTSVFTLLVQSHDRIC